MLRHDLVLLHVSHGLFDPRQRHENQKANHQQTVWRWMGLDP